MSVRKSSDSRPPEVFAIGPLPPPVNGLTMLTEKVVKQLQSAGPTTIVDQSPRPARKRIVFRIKRLLRSVWCLYRLLMHGRAQNTRLYLAANSKGGLMATDILVRVASWLKYPTYLHHHTYFYIDKYDWRMARIVRHLGPRGVHIVHCPEMADDFRARYPTSEPFQYVLPSVFSLPIGNPKSSVSLPFRLGFLANLSMAKGLDLVLDTFRTLHDSGLFVKLRLAGPCTTESVRRMINRELHRYPDSLEYVGPVYDRAKVDFYNSVDCFVYPSRSESWGIVLDEALSAGVPVIACRRGCARTVIGPAAGLIVEDDLQFVSLAAKQIHHWIDHPQEYLIASAAAIEQAQFLDRTGQAQLNHFISNMFLPLSE